MLKIIDNIINTTDIPDIWEKIKTDIDLVHHEKAQRLLELWVTLPGGKDFQNPKCCFNKQVSSYHELARALVHELCTTALIEEQDADRSSYLSDLNRFKTLEEPLNKVVNAILEYASKWSDKTFQEYLPHLDGHWFGKAVPQWSTGLPSLRESLFEISSNTTTRLYRKIGFILSFTRPNKNGECILKGCTPLSDQRGNAERLKDNWSLDEQNPDVVNRRDKCITKKSQALTCQSKSTSCEIMRGGTSGTTMDIIHVAIKLSKQENGSYSLTAAELTKICKSIDVYYHPRVTGTKWLTHSADEVERGCQIMISHHYPKKRIDISPRNLFDSIPGRRIAGTSLFFKPAFIVASATQSTAFADTESLRSMIGIPSPIMKLASVGAVVFYCVFFFLIWQAIKTDKEHKNTRRLL